MKPAHISTQDLLIFSAIFSTIIGLLVTAVMLIYEFFSIGEEDADVQLLMKRSLNRGFILTAFVFVTMMAYWYFGHYYAMAAGSVSVVFLIYLLLRQYSRDREAAGNKKSKSINVKQAKRKMVALDKLKDIGNDDDNDSDDANNWNQGFDNNDDGEVVKPLLKKTLLSKKQRKPMMREKIRFKDEVEDD